MKTKKTEKANLEKKRPTFMLIAFLTSLSVVLTAFEYNFPVHGHKALKITDQGEEIMEMVAPTVHKEEPKPPPPKETVVEIFEIEQNDKELENELDIKSTEADQDEIIGFIDLPAPPEHKEAEDSIYDFVLLEKPPLFPGGQQALAKWLATNINYPEQAHQAGIKGRVFIGFVVAKDGQIEQVQVLRGSHPLLDNEALRVVRIMPAWTPGKHRGRNVMVRYQVPIRFSLR